MQFLFPDPVKAVRECWLLGDDFFRSLFGSLAAIRTQVRINDKPQPYIYNHFEVKALHKNSYGNTKSRLARIFNSMVDEMNVEVKIPKAIVVILDCDVIEMAEKSEYGIRKLLYECFNWLVENINLELHDREEALYKKNPGALFDINEPKIIWVAPVVRPTTSALKNVFSLVQKFTAVMEECLEDKANNVILQLASINELVCFDVSGRLTPIGKECFWREVMSQLHVIIEKPENKQVPVDEKLPVTTKSSNNQRVTENNESAYRGKVQIQPCPYNKPRQHRDHDNQNHPNYNQSHYERFSGHSQCTHHGHHHDHRMHDAKRQRRDDNHRHPSSKHRR